MMAYLKEAVVHLTCLFMAILVVTKAKPTYLSHLAFQTFDLVIWNSCSCLASNVCDQGWTLTLVFACGQSTPKKKEKAKWLYENYMCPDTYTLSYYDIQTIRWSYLIISIWQPFRMCEWSTRVFTNRSATSLDCWKSGSGKKSAVIILFGFTFAINNNIE